MHGHLISSGFPRLWGDDDNGVARIRWNRNRDEFEGHFEGGIMVSGRRWKLANSKDKELFLCYEGQFDLHDNMDGTGYLIRKGLGRELNEDGSIYQVKQSSSCFALPSNLCAETIPIKKGRKVGGVGASR